MNITTDNSITSVNGVYESKGVTNNASNGANKVNADDTAAILTLSRNGDSDGVVNVKRTSSVSSANEREQLQIYQSKLSGLMFYNGPIDGNMSSSLTKKAISNFQRVYGLEVTGNFDNNTETMLEEVSKIVGAVCKDEQIKEFASKYKLDSKQIQNMAVTWAFLVKGMNLTTAQAAGAMGNIMHESRFSPVNAYDEMYPGDYNYNYHFTKDDNVAYGIIQWKDITRRGWLSDTASEMGLSAGDINVQFATIRKEAEVYWYGDDWEELRKCSNYSDSAKVFKNKIEGCDDNTLGNRTAYAKEIYNALK